ncbi:CehA/McbA family metallohydrolase [Agathobaculum sp. LCP25S3_E8]|uniref:CehA/McbA family metallohydrolase n=1 Tax=Agathobaculum sp. LCP25S3_E8 TaxID=3438735 RepID=UPI003F93E4D0
MKWYPVELHTHTEHSDGDFTVSGLVEAAHARGFVAVALTDHNTASGLREFYPALEREGLIGVAGIEWTTYFGHMLVLGEQGYTDWRGVQPPEIDRAIASIHQNGGIVGIAHPFALSNPVNTGYHWEFQVADWTAVDYLEVWSRDDAPRKIQSLRAFALWEQLLDRGCRITATSGRDWHREDTFAYAHTYVGVDGALTQDAILNAIRAGHVCLAAGPLLTMCGTDAQGVSWEIGDEVKAGPLEIELTVDPDTLPNDWDRSQVQLQELRLVQNGRILAVCPAQTHQRLHLSAAPGWLRADLIGTYYGRTGQHLAFTNPLFIRQRG